MLSPKYFVPIIVSGLGGASIATQLKAIERTHDLARFSSDSDAIKPNELTISQLQ